MASILIVAIPRGEAPLWVRQAWVGLKLPTRGGLTSGFGFGVVSGPKGWLSQLVSIFTGKAFRQIGFIVPAATAFDLLAGANPEAAQWWRENTPYLLRPGRYLNFDSGCANPCE